MAMPHDIEARRYYRVAFQRLDEGGLLLEQLGRPKAAVYLTGYAVECILKALLVTATPASQRVEVLRNFRGGRGHDLPWLADQLLRSGVRLPAAHARELAFLSSWSIDLRYEPGVGDMEEATRFLNAARSIVQWADGRL